MKVLVVGAGAVGQVYALYLSKAGCEVTFFVKEKYADDLRGDLQLYHLKRKKTIKERLSGFHLLTDTDEVAATHWDQVWLAISSDALRSDATKSLLGSIGSATVVVLQADYLNASYIRTIVPEEQVVEGEIPMISFMSPLPNRDGPKGMAYYLPPFAPTPLSGEDTRVQSLVRTLKRGGMRARQVKSIEKFAAVGAALGYPLLATIEANGWNLRDLPRTARMMHGLQAAKESLMAAEAETGNQLPTGFKLFLKPMTWNLLIPVLIRLFPFDLEVYLKYHFSKVGIQVRWVLDTYIDIGNKNNIPVISLEELRQSINSPLDS